MRVLVTGGREYGHKQAERDLIYRVLNETFPQTEPDQYGNTLPIGFLITGGARGVDTVAIDWAAVHWVPWQTYEVKEEDYQRFGKMAPGHRNQQMLDEGKPDLVLAFLGAGGTDDMVCRARDAKVPLKFAPVK